MLGPPSYYSNYQTGPRPSSSQGREGPDLPRFPPPIPSSNQTTTTLQHPSTPSRDPIYPLTSSQTPIRHSVIPPLRQHEPDRSPPNGASHQRRISAAPTSSGPTDNYLQRPSSSFGHPTPRTPRVIDERYVHGEGMCYVYEDGTRVQKYIDGENVNPQWGVTKAGKPRKRLAQACTTCREKKIKCDPSSPKCIQCQKFGRECRFENAPRGHHHLSSNFTPNMSRPNAFEQQQQQGASASPYTSEKNDISSLSPSSVKRSVDEMVQPNSVLDEHEIKRQRRGSASSSPERFQQTSKDLKGKSIAPLGPSQQQQQQQQQSSPHATKIDHSDVDGLNVWSHLNDAKIDPFEVDPESSNQYMNLYFDHVNASTYSMFPKEPFLDWCNTARNKTSDDRMLIFTLLAMGAVFSGRPDRTAILKRFMNKAEHVVQSAVGGFSLQLIQARIVLALTHFALGNSTKAWDFCGSAMRAACGFKLNTESGVSDVNDDQVIEYGLNKAALEECQRRTFWSVFIMDRFNGYCTGHSSSINLDDCYLRLPMSDSHYEQQLSLDTPFLRNSQIDPSLCCNSSTSNLGSMAHIVQVSAAWGEATAFIYRSSYLPASDYPHLYKEHHSSIMNRLSDWMSNLPTHLTWSQQNLDRSIQQGYVGTFISIHTLHHSTIIKLNRNLRFQDVPYAVRVRNVRNCLHHARALLQLTRCLAKEAREFRLHNPNPKASFSPSPSSPSSSISSYISTTFSVPFTGYAILIATDALTSAGLISDLPELMRLVDSGLEVLEELAQFWTSAKAQYRHVGQRLKLLANTLALYENGGIPNSQDGAGESNASLHNDSTAPHGDEHHSSKTEQARFEHPRAWSVANPIELTFPKSDDLIYSLDRNEFLPSVTGIMSLTMEEDVVVIEDDVNAGLATGTTGVGGVTTSNQGGGYHKRNFRNGVDDGEES